MLRTARRDDVAFIQTILNAPDNLGKLEGYDDATLETAITDSGARVFVWEEAGDLLGFCWLNADAEGWKVEEFGVASPGGGVGSRFFRSVLAAIDTDGLWLAVAADNEPAIRFYERFGFAVTARRSELWQRRAGTPVAPVIMRLKGR